MAKKTNAAPQPAKPLPGDLIYDEVERLTADSGFKLDLIGDSHCVHFTIDLEHWSETFEMIAVHNCYGNVAKQIVAECERVTGVYRQLAQAVKERVWQDYVKENGDQRIEAA